MGFKTVGLILVLLEFCVGILRQQYVHVQFFISGDFLRSCPINFEECGACKCRSWCVFCYINGWLGVETMVKIHKHCSLFFILFVFS